MFRDSRGEVVEVHRRSPTADAPRDPPARPGTHLVSISKEQPENETGPHLSMRARFMFGGRGRSPGSARFASGPSAA